MSTFPVDDRPGLTPARLARLAQEAVERCELTLYGVRVLTEAATGAYVVTPVIAALAGADVVAVTSDSQYGSAAAVERATLRLASLVGVADRVIVRTDRPPKLFADADVVTNSGHLRPIVGEVAERIRARAALPLMFEAWEIQAGRIDIDLDSLRARGVQVAGTNERHPDVDVLSFLGPMAVAGLADAGVSAYRGRIAVLCDNPFRDFLDAGLKAVGAEVRLETEMADLLAGPEVDALVVAMTPTGSSVLSTADVAAFAARWPGAPVLQFWGDVDREVCARSKVACWPPTSPGTGHMGVLPSRVGPEPIVRLQTGGLKVAQVLLKPDGSRTPEDLAYLDPL